MEQESSAEILLIAECFSRNHSPAMFLGDAWRHAGFKANSGSGSAIIINEFWQEMEDYLTMVRLCHIQFLFLLTKK